MKILIFGNGVMANIVKDCVKEPNIYVDMVNPLENIAVNSDFDVIIK